jgi:hypothetical protein
MENILPTPEEKRLIAIDDRIDNYLFGRMTKEEEQTFLSDCKTDNELRHRAYMTALMVKAINK